MVTVTTRSSKNLSKRTQVYEESEYCLIATFQFTPLIIISASVYITKLVQLKKKITDYIVRTNESTEASEN